MLIVYISLTENISSTQLEGKQQEKIEKKNIG